MWMVCPGVPGRMALDTQGLGTGSRLWLQGLSWAALGPTQGHSATLHVGIFSPDDRICCVSSSPQRCHPTTVWWSKCFNKGQNMAKSDCSPGRAFLSARLGLLGGQRNLGGLERWHRTRTQHPNIPFSVSEGHSRRTPYLSSYSAL